MDREFLIDLFASFRPVTIRPMFSGFGISADGVNFALALRSGLYLRADEVTVAQFEAAGSKPFQYQTRAKTVTVGSYWQVPAHLFDDADEFGEWARAALGAAQRAALQKRSKGRSRKQPAAESGARAKSRPAKTASKRSVGRPARTIAKAKSGNKTGDKSGTRRAKKSATTKKQVPHGQSRARSAAKKAR